MKIFCLLFILIFAVLQVCPIIADQTGLPESAHVSTSQHQPETGHALTINLGFGVKLHFIWIKSLKMWVGQFEVTNAQYLRFHPAHKSQQYQEFSMDGHNYPVSSVSWNDASNYCAWLNRNFRSQLPHGYACRLPTEKEWEIFASCGDSRGFPWGGKWPPPDQWNYRGQEGTRGVFRLFQHAERFVHGHNDGFIVSCPVNQAGYNEWSLYGTGGNVWEWCNDWFDADLTTRVLRGASWANYQKDMIAISYRNEANPSRKSAMVGFRVVVAPVNR